MIDEGVIKFQCRWTPAKALPSGKLSSLIDCRRTLYNTGLIGAYADGTGFGNISRRDKLNPDRFIVSGTQTGGLPEVDGRHFTLVTTADIPRNTLTCKGPLKASSESMTHAALYSCSPSINAVIHIHNLSAWKTLLNTVPTTDKNVPYGTPAMAREIIRLYSESTLHETKLLAMGGHREGIIAFGRTLPDALGIVTVIPGIFPA